MSAKSRSFRRNFSLFVPLSLLAATAGAAPHPAPAASAEKPPAAARPSSEDQKFAKLVDTLVDEYTGFRPSEATSLGLHGHDGELEDLSPAGIAREQAWLKEWEARLAGVSGERLSAANRFDLALLRQALQAMRFSLTETQDHRHRPGLYLRLAADSVNQLIKRDFAPAETRLRSVVKRQARLLSMLQTAEQNLDQMAPISIDITLSDLDATVHFFSDDVPKAFPQLKDARLKAELSQSCNAVATALRHFGEFLRQAKSGPRAKASFALGAELYRKRLWAEEMIDEPIDSLMRRSEAELRRLQGEFRATAARIDARQPAAAIQLEMQKDHPTPDKIISETASRLATQQHFLIEKGLITLPSQKLPEVKESPPFMRATTLASMDASGPFETAQLAYYYVTLPESSWRPEQTEDFMRGAYNRPLIDVVNIHEAFPGHYVQGLWQTGLSKARKVFGAGSNIEGWAHYTEQMMLDENYGDGNPRLRLAQLQDALLRSARFVVALRMHTQGMTVAQATDFFQREGFQTRKVSEMEALRGTQDPMYLVYTYGKLEILKLRRELQQKQGAAFSLRRFHDDLLSYGKAPLKMIREAMLGTP